MIKRVKEDVNTRVYKYGLVPTAPFPEAGIDQLFKANRLWNSLVEIHNTHQDAYDAARFEADGEYALICQSIDELEEEIKEAIKEKRQARMKATTTDKEHPLIKAANAKIDALYQQQRTLWQDAKPHRVRADKLIDKKKLNKQFNEAVNKAGRIKQSGLMNNTADAIRDKFQTARMQAFKNRARLRFHRFDGTGRLAYRLRETSSKTDGIPFDYLFSKEKLDQQTILLSAQAGNYKKPRYPVRIKVAGSRKESSKVYADFHLIMHRPIPEKAQIQNAQLIRERIGDRFKFFLCFTVREPRIQRDEKKSALGVDIGFRKQGDGSIRVATISGGRKNDTPHFVELSPAYLNTLDYIEKLQSELSKSTERLGAEIKPHLKAGSVLPEDHKKYKMVKAVANAPANRPLFFEVAYKLARWVNYEQGVLPKKVEQSLMAWLGDHGRAYREHHNLRHKLIDQRNHHYKNEAAKLIAHGRPIGIEKIDLRRFAEIKDKDNKLGVKPRSNRFIAGVSLLLDAIKNAGQREGIRVIEVNPKNTSRRCHGCGEINQQLEAETNWDCPNCKTHHDRDVNAAINIGLAAEQKLAEK